MNTIPAFMPLYYSGLSGIQLPIPTYLFPPPYEGKSRLHYYASLYNSIEINSSFYKIPRAKTVSNWADSTPEDFKFTFKLWKGITHIKYFDFNAEDVSAFFESVKAVDKKKGSILIQFPPSLGYEYFAQLDKLLSCFVKLDPSREWKVAVEFRNKSWYNDQVYGLLKRFAAAIVIHDIPKSATPDLEHDSDFMYIRFHGPTGNYRESYSDEFIHEYATYIMEWINEGKRVYVYFNNTMGNAINNLVTLNKCLVLNFKAKLEIQ